MKQRYFKCQHCGNIIAMVKASGVPIMCCGEKMKELVPGETDGAMEKHVPVYSQEGSKVTVAVGEIEHPSLPEHFIQWVVVETDKGAYMKELEPGKPPRACLQLCEDEKVTRVLEYCNLHGLWQA